MGVDSTYQATQKKNLFEGFGAVGKIKSGKILRYLSIKINLTSRRVHRVLFVISGRYCA